MEFFELYQIEAFDLVNVFFYNLFYNAFQFFGIWGYLFKDSKRLSNSIKFLYLGF